MPSWKKLISSGSNAHLNAVTASSDIIISQDSKKLMLGAGNDLQIYHDGTSNYIDLATSDQDFKLRVNDGGVTTTAIQIDSSEIGRVKLPNDDQQLTIGAGQDLRFYHTNDTSNIVNFNGALTIQNAGAGSTIIKNTSQDEDIFLQVNDGGSTINAIRIDASDNARVKLANDNQKLSIGASNDLELYHQSGNSIIKNVTGQLILMNSAQDQDMAFQVNDGGSVQSALRLRAADKAVRLPYDNQYLMVGAGDDLRMRHNGSNSFIENITGHFFFDSLSHGSKMQFATEDSSGTKAYVLNITGDNHFVGIGETSPEAKLHVKNASAGTFTASNSQLLIENNTTVRLTMVTPTNNASKIEFGDIDDQDAGILEYNNSDNSMRFTTNTSEAMRIDSSGNVGIGTTTPTSELTVEGDISGSGTGSFERIVVGGGVFTSASLAAGGSGGGSSDITMDGSTANGLLTYGGTDNIDVESNLTFDGSHLRLPNNSAVIMGASDAFVINHNGSHNYIQNTKSDADVYFTVNDGGSTINALIIDSSEVANIVLPNDGQKLLLGASSDLQFYHDGSNNFLRNNTTDQDFSILVNDGGSTITALQIDSSNVGRVILPNDNQKLTIGAGYDLNLYNNGSVSYISNSNNYFTIDQNAAAGMQLRNLSSDQDITFSVNAGGGQITAIQIDASNSGSLVLPNDNQNFYVGASNDFRIVHNGTDTYLNNHTGDFIIQNFADDKDISLRSDNGSGGSTPYITLDGSATSVNIEQDVKLTATKKLYLDGGGHTYIHEQADDILEIVVGGEVQLKLTEAGNGVEIPVDSHPLKIGAGSDLQFTHNGTNSFIDNYTGTLNITNNTDDGDIVLKSDDGSGGTTAYLTLDGSASLTKFHIDTKHLDSVTANFGDSADLQIYHNGSHSYIDQVGTGHLYIRNTTDDKQIIIQTDDGSGGVTDYMKFKGDENLIRTFKNFRLHDSVQLQIGTGADMDILHDGSNATIRNGTGNLSIEQQTDDGDLILKCDDGSGGVTAYLTLDGGQKFVSIPSDSIEFTLGASGDIRLLHNGSNSQFKNYTGAFYIQQNAVAPFYIDQQADDSDLILRSDDGSGGVTPYITLDGSTGDLLLTPPTRTEIQGNLVVEGDLTAQNYIVSSSITYMTQSFSSGSTIFGDSIDDTHQFTGSVQITGSQSVVGDVEISATNKLYLDGGTHTYIYEQAADTLDFVVGGQQMLTMVEGGTDYVRVGDNILLGAGNSLDMYMKHDGTNSSLVNGTGALYIDALGQDSDFFIRVNDGGVTKTALKIDSSEIGNVHLPNWNQALKVGASGNILLYHSSTAAKFVNITGDMEIENTADDKDIILKSDDGSGGTAAYITLDGSAGFTTVQKLMRFNDDVDARFGTGSDLRIRHNGTNSRIDNYTGTLQIRNTLDDADITLETDDGSGGITPYITLDGSATNTILHQDTILNDDKVLYVGNDLTNGLRLFHLSSNNNNYVRSNGGPLNILTAVSQPIYLNTNNTNAITISTAQKVGIGTTSPQEKLDVVSGSAHIRGVDSEGYVLGLGQLANTPTTPLYKISTFDDTSGGTSGLTSGDHLEIYGTRWGFQNTWARGGQGGAVPVAALYSSAGESRLSIYEALNPSSDATYSERIRLRGNGDSWITNKLGVGTTSPDTTLDIFSSGVNGILLNQQTSDSNTSARLMFKQDDTTFTMYGSGGNLEFRSGGTVGSSSGTAQFRITENSGVRIPNDNDTLALGAGEDLYMYHDGSDSFIRNQTGGLYIDQLTDDGNLALRCDNGSGGTTAYLTLNGASTLIDVAKNMRFADSIKSMYGASSDLQIYHNGTNSFGADNYTGHLIFQNRADDSDIIFKTDDGSGGVATYLTLDGSASTVEIAKDTNITGNLLTGQSSNPTLEIRNTATSAGSGAQLIFGHSQAGTTQVARLETHLLNGSESGRAGNLEFWTSRSGTAEQAAQLTHDKYFFIYEAGDTSDYLRLHSDSSRAHYYSPNNYHRFTTASGYIELGPGNSSWGHIQTDRDKFYFNKQITVDSGIVSAYDEDLSLRRAHDSSADRIDITADYSRIIVNDTERFRADTAGADVTGILTVTGDVTSNGNSVVTKGSLSSNTLSNITTFTSNDNIETSSGNQSGLQVYQDTGGADAFMTFHINGDFAGYFGIDGAINDLAVGGWSYGNGNKYRVFHAGNSTNIISLGTITTGTWNGSVIASAYLDADTAHLSGTQTFTGQKTFTEQVTMNFSDTGERLYIQYNGTTVGDIGANDTSWLRINQSTAKNIYTPRYIRADSGFFVDGATQGITGAGVFRAPNGSVGTPTYSFSNDTNTGMYLITGDKIGLSTGGVVRAEINSSGINSLNSSGYYIDDRRIYDTPSNSTDRGGFHAIIAGLRNSGKQRYLDEDFNNGTNSVTLYNNAGGTNLVVSRITASDDSIVPPNSSGKVIKVAYNGNGSTSPGFGGVYQLINTEENHTFVQIFQAKLPSGRTFVTAANSMGNNSTDHFLTSPEGTGKWEWYARVCHAGDSGTFSTSGFIYVTGGSDTAFTWYIANMTQYDVTETPGDYASQTGYYRSIYDVNATLARGLNDDDRIVVEASETKVIGDSVERARFGSYGIRNNVVGSAGTPSYSFVSDTNTGMLRTAEDTIGFATGGSTRFTMNGSGVLYVSSAVQAGNGGIQIWDGTHGFKTVLAKDSTYTKLLNNDGAVCLYLGDGGDRNNYHDAGGHRFRSATGGTYFGSINGTGLHLGTGNTFASTRLDVDGTSNFTGEMYIDHGGSDYAPGINFMGGTNTPGSNTYENAKIAYYDNSGTGLMRFSIGRGAGTYDFYLGGSKVFGVDAAGQGRFIGSTDIGLVVASTDAGSGIAVKDSNTGGDYYNGMFCATNDLFFKSNNVERMRIDSSGNVSVGGNITLTSGHSFRAHNESSYTKYRLYSTSGAYCIGMISSTGFGAVDSWAMTFTFSDETNRGFLWRKTSHSSGQGAMSLNTEGKLNVAHSVRVGYGISDGTAPGATYALDVSGQIAASNDITAFASDERLKRNIKLIESPLEKVSQLSGFTYNFNNTAKELADYDTEQNYVGVSAQEVKKVQPEAVKLAPFDTDASGSISGEDYLTVQYEKLVPLLVESVKELTKQNKEQQKTIEEQQQRLTKLEEKSNG